MQPEQQQRIMGYFIEEAKDHLNTIEQGLLNLQSTIEDPEMVNELFRAAHSVKGGAAMLGLNSIQQVSHRLEDFFKILKDSRVSVDQKLVSLFLKVFDALQELVEQLQGPFGLTEDAANTTLAGVQPTFDELENHLTSLVSEAGEPMTSMPTTGFLVGDDFVPAASLDEMLVQTFGTEVPARLREMLQLFKRSDVDTTSRQQLQEICQELLGYGETFEITPWCRLIETAKAAIADLNNPYRTLAPVVIRDIKQAQDLVLQGRSDAIAPCSQLQEMVSVVPSAAVAADSDFADLLAAADDTDLSLDFGSEDDSGDDLLFGDLADLPVTPSTELNFSSELDFGTDFTSDFNAASAERNGPEVGMAELNSLADLFEGEVPDLGATWQEEEIVSDMSAFSDSLGSTASEQDETADFSDLLFDESDSNQMVIQADADDLSDLFGDDLLEEESTGESLLSFDESSSDDLEDLLSISANDSDANPENGDAIATSTEADPFAGLDFGESMELDPFATNETESSTSSDTALGDDLGELFAGMDDGDLDLSNSQSNSEELFASLGSETDDNPFNSLLDSPTTEANLEPVSDPWEESTSDATLPSADHPLEEPSLTSEDLFGEGVAADTSDFNSLLGEDGDAGAIEELSDQGDIDFSGLFETDTTPSSDASDDLAIEELTDASSDFSNESWLTEPANGEELELSTAAEPIDVDLLSVDDSLNPLAGLGQDSTADAFSDFNLDQPDPLATETDFASDLESSDDLLEMLSVDSSSEGDVGGGLELDLGEFDLNQPEETLTPAAEDNLGFDLEGFAALETSEVLPTEPESDRGLDFGDLNLTADTADLNLSSDAEQDMDSLLGDMGFSEIGELEAGQSNTEDFSDFNLSDDSILLDLGDEASETNGSTDPFAEDLATITGVSAEAEIADDNEFSFLDSDPAADDLLGLPELDNSNLSDAPASVGDLDLDLGLDGELHDLDLDLSDTDDSLEFSALSPENELPPAAIDPGESGEEPLDDLDDLLGESSLEIESGTDNGLSDLDDLLGDETDSFLAEELGDTDLLMGEAIAPSGEVPDLADVWGDETSSDSLDASTDLNSLLDDQTTSFTEETSIGEFDDLLGEDLTASGDELSDLNLTSEEITSPADQLADLDNLMGEEPISADNELGDLDGLLGETDISEEALGNLDDFSGEPFTGADEFGDLSNLLVEQESSDTEFGDLNNLLNEQESSDTEFGDLNNLVGEQDSEDLDFGDLDDLVGDEAPAENGFGDLESLLDEGMAPATPISSLGAVSGMLDSSFTDSTNTEDFSDLEALLQGEESVSTPVQPASTSGESEFDELDDLLKDAEEKMGGSPSVSVSRGMAPQSRRLTRPGRIFSEQTMRVPVKHLDNLSNLVGELVVNRNSLEQDQERLRQSLDNLLYQVQQLSDVGQRMQDLYERSLLESSLLASRQNYRHGSSSSSRNNDAASTQTVNEGVEYDPLEMDRFTGFHSLSQEMIELIVRVRESASDIEFIVDETDQVTRMFRQVTTQLQEGLTRSRMVPFAQTADRMPRAVRDIAMKVGKQAELVIEGRETLIDKMILEQLYDPMTHLVNNAITHGIESPEVRRSAGKSAAGRITIRAFHQGNQTIISVSDDGAGIDVERVKTKAIEKGLISPAEARSMSRLDVYDLLFHAGFSTKDQADDFAGRGVGMDVVRTSLSEIRGVINTDSNPGKGTTFTIRLPLTLSISKALCCISDRARIAFPMDGVEDMLDVPKERIQTNAEGQPCLPWRDSLLPLRPLNELLAYNRHLSRGNVYGGNQEDDISSIVVLRSAGNFLALQVDQVLGEQEIVIKQLEGPVPKPVGVAGATVLGDGRIMPIADVLELIDLAMGRIRKDAGGSLWDQGSSTAIQEPPAVVKTEPMVLIVDDSITVRELLSMTFNKVGYRVEQARDGQEAWEKLRSGLPCDIVFCDIEMPRMDGLELLSRIQKDPNLTHLPIAMLTSRGADRHRQMAASLGASGYFTKPYLEEALLDAAQRMLKGERLLTQ